MDNPETYAILGTKHRIRRRTQANKKTQYGKLGK
jgi:hypothetical protein